MAAPGSVTGTVQTKVYAKTGTSAFTTDADLAAAKGSAGFNVTTATNQVKNVTSFGPLSISGNQVEYTPLGGTTTKAIAGAASLGELSFTIAIIESDTLHAKLVAATVGTFIEVLAFKAVGTAEAAYYARGEISGTEQTLDTPNELTVTIALAEAPKRLA